MALQVVFSNNLDPATANLSSRFTNAVAFYIAAPLISSELEIDVFLQIYFPAVAGEQVRNIPLGKIEEQAILLNLADTETAQVIPVEFSDTGLEMALLFLASNTTFLQAAIVTKNCSLSDVCNGLEAVNLRLSRIEQSLGVPTQASTPTSDQQDFFFLQ